MAFIGGRCLFEEIRYTFGLDHHALICVPTHYYTTRAVYYNAEVWNLHAGLFFTAEGPRSWPVNMAISKQHIPADHIILNPDNQVYPCMFFSPLYMYREWCLTHRLCIPFQCKYHQLLLQQLLVKLPIMMHSQCSLLFVIATYMYIGIGMHTKL